MFTCAKISLLLKRKQITENQHDWIIFVKNEISRNIPNIREPSITISEDGIFRLRWSFTNFPKNIATIDFFKSGFWKTSYSNGAVSFDENPTKFLSYQFLDFLKKHATKN